MQKKKHSRFDLENKKGIFFQVGIAIALAIVLTGFEWRFYDQVDDDYIPSYHNTVPEEMIPLTRQETPVPLTATPVVSKKPRNINIIVVDHQPEDSTFSETDFSLENGNENNNENTAVNGGFEENVLDNEIFTIISEPPAYPGGESERIHFIQKNIEYPKFARQNKIQGSVYVTFVVEKDGSLTNIKVLRGIGGGCDDEALRIVRAMPKWIPGSKNGFPVRVQITMPVTYVLQSSS